MSVRNQPSKRRQEALLATQTALLGEVCSRLRAVAVGWGEEVIEIQLLYDGEINEDDLEDVSTIESEIMASFPEDRVIVTAKRHDAPSRLSQHALGAWAFMRKECTRSGG